MPPARAVTALFRVFLGIALLLPATRLDAQKRARVSATGQSAQQHARVEAAVRALFAAAERGDLAALDTLYAGDSLTIIEGAGINRGWADYRDHHLGPEIKEMQNFRYRPFEIETHVSGPHAWAIFRYALTAEMSGKPVDAVGRGTAILEQRKGTWIVRHTQTSSRARRPADPPVPQ